MEIKKEKKENAIRLSTVENGAELGAVYLYLIRNDSHKEPYGLLEDLLLKETHRKKGVGSMLVKERLKRRNVCTVTRSSARAGRHVKRFTVSMKSLG